MAHIRIMQTSPRLGVLDENIARHREALGQASADGVDLLVFPELSLTGYLLKDLVPDVALTQEELVERIVGNLSGISNLEAVIGFVEETPRHRFHNSAAVLRWDSGGGVELVHIHRKIYLPTYGLFDEGRYFVPGREVRAFESNAVGRCGILNCEDAWHLSLPLLLAMDGPLLEGAGVLVIPSNSPSRGVSAKSDGIPESHRTWINLLETYSTLLGTVVVYASRAGVEDGLTFAGGSRIVEPGGGCLAEATLFEETVLDLEIDWTELMRGYRVRSPILASENVDLVQRELARITRHRPVE